MFRRTLRSPVCILCARSRVLEGTRLSLRPLRFSRASPIASLRAPRAARMRRRVFGCAIDAARVVAVLELRQIDAFAHVNVYIVARPSCRLASAGPIATGGGCRKVSATLPYREITRYGPCVRRDDIEVSQGPTSRAAAVAWSPSRSCLSSSRSPWRRGDAARCRGPCGSIAFRMRGVDFVIMVSVSRSTRCRHGEMPSGGPAWTRRGLCPARP